mmetsp:Transcript_22164/g.47665  ORF Transcript_22164/g.47665 Transcript_22164/m.47665 type:complete len:578 (+) Transcript_22164:118-1851(+)|eukprot:CAMPEP_0172543570 /NCGR_PEP_ID=MMETSP1067-20121228/13917_1 /TAXON_ID=265564 ORGANISM="Thalassiosira punctigera, Strain Tpunct2005C2" /NCGR_SAMPLE_ID=MMETSP1067 /ASSEMBLY_ACC=CAM_ASM_000444 /LENGTH=577 /DNA_ID=CAMNT_0013330007 /DNA_START=106 /DNA_END=1839 /DNA_ORIENTATION=+
MKTRSRRSTVPHAAVNGDDELVSSQQAAMSFTFDGKLYSSYQEMVDAKRKRNRAVLVSSGLLEAKAAVDDLAVAKKRAASEIRGLKRAAMKTSRDAPPPPRRKSSRIAGGPASGAHVVDERAGRFEISGMGSIEFDETKPEFYNGRVNDGSDLSIAEAVELTGSKWVKEGTVGAAELFMKNSLTDIIDDLPIILSRKGRGSPTSVSRGPTEIKSDNLQDLCDSLVLDNVKVTPERIYSVACHPSPDNLIACAGDKKGFLGIWNVDQHGMGSAEESSSSNDGVHLFKPHNGAVSSLAWNPSGTILLSASYDGSVRAFDANKQVFEELFATYDDSDIYKEKMGYKTDHGYNSWIQSMELDHRFEGGKCFFLSTSEGGVIHIDSRAKGKVTFDQVLSTKKINTVSLHPNGHTMATAGLSTMVELWDVRKMPSYENSSMRPKPLAWQTAGRSINSAFFSPSGSRLLTTTQSNTLDILTDAHLAAGIIKPAKSVKHDNQTGRWLSTFMARWHPSSLLDKEVFVVGSMQQPRTIEVFGGDGELLRQIRGEELTAVASRCCFHPSADKLIVVGGNSSGRVTVAR